MIHYFVLCWNILERLLKLEGLWGKSLAAHSMGKFGVNLTRMAKVATIYSIVAVGFISTYLLNF